MAWPHQTMFINCHLDLCYHKEATQWKAASPVQSCPDKLSYIRFARCCGYGRAENWRLFEWKSNIQRCWYIDQNSDNFTDILGYHKSFQIVDYTIANIQKISLSEIVSSVSEDKIGMESFLLWIGSANRWWAIYETLKTCSYDINLCLISQQRGLDIFDSPRWLIIARSLMGMPPLNRFLRLWQFVPV